MINNGKLKAGQINCKIAKYDGKSLAYIFWDIKPTVKLCGFIWLIQE
jgi:hypothetical protein